MQGSHIFFTGFMGSGKSYTGKRLANRLSLPFIDLDDWIEQWKGQTISNLFESEGEPGFRLAEAEALRAMANEPSSVIACGGGTACFHGNMDWMNRHGITIFIDTPLPILFQRLSKEKIHRPLLRHLNDIQMMHFLENKLLERRPFYEQARLIFRPSSAQDDITVELEKKLSALPQWERFRS